MTPLHRLAVVALASAGALALAAAGLQGAEPAAPDAPRPTKVSWRFPLGDPAHGQQLAQPCLACHARNSPPTTPPAPKLHRQRQSYIARALFAFRDGQRESPIMGPMAADLTDQDIRDIAAYLGGGMLDKPPMPNTTTAAYRRTMKDCAWCHGETGISELEGMPVLTGQDAAYLANALTEYRSGIRRDPTMRGVAAKLSPEEVKALAAYYSQYQWLEKLK